MERTILHVDGDRFYSAVECFLHPEIRDKPVAVVGDPELRHGIVLTRNTIASRYGVKTGEAIWEARLKCPDLVLRNADYYNYQRFSKAVRKILLEYTDQVEPFGIDESWIDVTGSIGLLGSGEKIAKEIQHRVNYELGITVSIGISYNKVFAKLGSDQRKPNGMTVITEKNFRETVWPLPVASLLYVGPATICKLYRYGIHTIGELATMPPGLLQRWFGKWGLLLYTFANGADRTEVGVFDEMQTIKSVGNSITAARDILSPEDANMVFWVLAECVAQRMRELGVKGRTVGIYLRTTSLCSFSRQHKTDSFTNLASEIETEAMRLLSKNYRWQEPLRSIGVSVSDFAHELEVEPQCSLFYDQKERDKLENLERTMDGIRNRFGSYSIRRASLLADPHLTHFDPLTEHTIHPVGFL